MDSEAAAPERECALTDTLLLGIRPARPRAGDLGRKDRKPEDRVAHAKRQKTAAS
jgi:hypothetical protein